MAINHVAAMQYDEETGVTKVTLGGLHDVIANTHQFDDGNALQTIDRYELVRNPEDDGIGDLEYAQAELLIDQLNLLRRMYTVLDQQFHELFGCR